MTIKPTVTIERAGTGADGHARAVFRLPDGKQLTVVVEPEGDGSVTWPNGIITELTPPALLPDLWAAPDPVFPLAHRTDLPQHEREISAESLAALDLGIAQVKAGQTVELREENTSPWCTCGKCGPCPRLGQEGCTHDEAHPIRFVTKACRNAYEKGQVRPGEPYQATKPRLRAVRLGLTPTGWKPESDAGDDMAVRLATQGLIQKVDGAWIYRTTPAGAAWLAAAPADPMLRCRECKARGFAEASGIKADGTPFTGCTFCTRLCERAKELP